MEHKQNQLILPVSIVSPTDIARLTREIEVVDNYFRDQAIRSPGEQQTAMPRLSSLMDQLVSNNQVNLLQEGNRKLLVSTLEQLHETAPVLHISFSVDPPGTYVQKIVAWLRKNIHPQLLVTVGLQPNIGAGCVVRSNSKMFDFSLREFFSQKHDFFIEKLHQALVDTPEQTPAPAPQPQAEALPPTPVAVESTPKVEVVS